MKKIRTSFLLAIIMTFMSIHIVQAEAVYNGNFDGIQWLPDKGFMSYENMEYIEIYNPDCMMVDDANILPTNFKIIEYSNPTSAKYARENENTFNSLELNEEVNLEKSNAELVSLMPMHLSETWPVDDSAQVYNADGHFEGYQMYMMREHNFSNPDFQEVKETVLNITRDKNTDYQKLCAIVEWVYNNMEYVYFDIPGNSLNGVYSLFYNRHGNCMGFTILTNFMLAAADIPSASVTSAGHQWSLALVDGEWYMADSTINQVSKDYDSFNEAVQIAFSDDNLCCIIDSLNGVWLAGIGEDPEDAGTITNVTIPRYIDGIYNTAVSYCSDELIINATVGSAAEEFIKQKSYECIKYNGNTFSARLNHRYDYTGVCDLCGVSGNLGSDLGGSNNNGFNPYTDFDTGISNDADVPYVNRSEWAVPEIQAALDNGLIDESTIISYQANIRREEFCDLVVRLFENMTGGAIIPGYCPFEDTSNPSVIKAYSVGIVNGESDTEFMPYNLITRQEICTMLVRAIKIMRPGINVADYRYHSFNDAMDIAPWAFDSVQYAYDNNIMQGVGDNMLAPLDHTTIEQAVAMINRIYNNYSK